MKLTGLRLVWLEWALDAMPEYAEETGEYDPDDVPEPTVESVEEAPIDVLEDLRERFVMQAPDMIEEEGTRSDTKAVNALVDWLDEIIESS